MSILNVNQIQPVGSGQTVTISATNIDTGSATVTAGTFTGNLTGNVTSSSTSTFSNGLNVTGGSVGIGSDSPANILDVQGNEHAKIHIGTTGNGYATGIQINHAKGAAGQQSWQLQTDATTDGNLKIRNATSGNDVMFFREATDNVEIANGNLVFSTSGTGIDFSATANGSGTTTSELLDDYEEGTWTPTIDLSVSSPTYSKQEGKYTKIGNVVNVSCTLAISSGTTDGSTFRVGGFPFSALNLNDRAFTGIVRVNSVSSNGEKLYVFMNANASTAFLNTQTATGSGGFTGNQFGTTGSISFSLTYIEA